MVTARLEAALAAVDGAALARDISAAVRVPSVTGGERPVLELLQAQAAALGLESRLVQEDLAALERHPAYPGREAPRSELWNLVVTLPGSDPEAGRLAVCGHVDVVTPGTERWSRDPFSGELSGGRVWGRGSIDMKGGVVAALHALAALRIAGGAPATLELLAVSSEEDGGLGAFAALERDASYDACLIPEPTELAVVCARSGTLTFTGTVHGRGAHAAVRLEGVSAIDRYVPLHLALQAHERRINAAVDHPLMRLLPLPYPIVVGRLEAGLWSSQVPDRLVFEGRLGVRIGESPEAARAGLEAALREADDGAGPPVELRWSGGQFRSGETAVDDPVVPLVQGALAAETGGDAPLAGVPYGADMRLFCERGIPTVMAGARGLARAHAVDEWADVDELTRVARMIVRVALGFRRRP
jgi:acetylornithine deacetylase